LRLSATNKRGPGGAFGFPAIPDISATLEAAARTADVRAIGLSATALTASLDQILADRGRLAITRP